MLIEHQAHQSYENQQDEAKSIATQVLAYHAQYQWWEEAAQTAGGADNTGDGAGTTGEPL